MFEASFNVTLDRYRKLLGQVSTGQLDLPNDNFDTVKQLVPENIGFNDETPQSCSTRSRNRPFGVLRRRFGPNSWNFTGIRTLPTRPSSSLQDGAKVQVQLEQLKTAVETDSATKSGGIDEACCDGAGVWTARVEMQCRGEHKHLRE